MSETMGATADSDSPPADAAAYRRELDQRRYELATSLAPGVAWREGMASKLLPLGQAKYLWEPPVASPGVPAHRMVTAEQTAIRRATRPILAPPTSDLDQAAGIAELTLKYQRLYHQQRRTMRVEGSRRHMTLPMRQLGFPHYGPRQREGAGQQLPPLPETGGTEKPSGSLDPEESRVASRTAVLVDEVEVEAPRVISKSKTATSKGAPALIPLGAIAGSHASRLNAAGGGTSRRVSIVLPTSDVLVTEAGSDLNPLHSPIPQEGEEDGEGLRSLASRRPSDRRASNASRRPSMTPAAYAKRHPPSFQPSINWDRWDPEKLLTSLALPISFSDAARVFWTPEGGDQEHPSIHRHESKKHTIVLHLLLKAQENKSIPGKLASFAAIRQELLLGGGPDDHGPGRKKTDSLNAVAGPLQDGDDGEVAAAWGKGKGAQVKVAPEAEAEGKKKGEEGKAPDLAPWRAAVQAGTRWTSPTPEVAMPIPMPDISSMINQDVAVKASAELEAAVLMAVDDAVTAKQSAPSKADAAAPDAPAASPLGPGLGLRAETEHSSDGAPSTLEVLLQDVDPRAELARAARDRAMPLDIGLSPPFHHLPSRSRSVSGKPGSASSVRRNHTSSAGRARSRSASTREALVTATPRAARAAATVVRGHHPADPSATATTTAAPRHIPLSLEECIEQEHLTQLAMTPQLGVARLWRLPRSPALRARDDDDDDGNVDDVRDDESLD